MIYIYMFKEIVLHQNLVYFLMKSFNQRAAAAAKQQQQQEKQEQQKQEQQDKAKKKSEQGNQDAKENKKRYEREIKLIVLGALFESDFIPNSAYAM